MLRIYWGGVVAADEVSNFGAYGVFGFRTYMLSSFKLCCSIIIHIGTRLRCTQTVTSACHGIHVIIIAVDPLLRVKRRCAGSS
jgi:hypothetical protein